MAITHFSNVTTDGLVATTITSPTFVAGSTEFHPVVVDVTSVDASTNATAGTVTCTLVPADSILLNVVAYVTTTFNGDTTQTIEVGITGNTDKYIDTSDLDPAAAPGQLDIQAGTNQDQKGVEYCLADTQVICTWTNTTGATAGAASVYVVYQPLA